jgi:acetylornithine deacetylase/succinyl-diaminopimelate desuccinylase-like protein
VGVPAVTVSLRGLANVVVSVRSLSNEVHSGMFGGAAPDALAALIRMLASLRDEAGNTTIAGLDSSQVWSGEPYPPERFRVDAGVLDGVSLLGSGSVSDMIWARPSVTVLGIDCPPVVGSAAAIQPRARARLNLRVPPGMDPVKAGDALAAHLQAAAPWGAQVTVGSPTRKLPASPMTIASAFSSSGRLSAYRSRPPVPCSSDPSTMSLRLTGTSSPSARNAVRCMTMLPLQSAAPRPYHRPPTSVSANGGVRQACSSSGGCTS